MNDQSINITMMRHGRSLADDENVHEGRYDSPLTDAGRAQATHRAKDFSARQLHFDQIIASPLKRAKETAIIIGNHLNVPVETAPEWMEMDNGPLAGMPKDQAAIQYPLPAFRNPYEAWCETGESDWEIFCRAAKAVENVIRRGEGSYLIVAHGGILNSAMRAIIGLQPSINHQGISFGFGDTGFVRLTYYPKTHEWFMFELFRG